MTMCVTIDYYLERCHVVTLRSQPPLNLHSTLLTRKTMADNMPTENPKSELYDDPFSDHTREIRFHEPTIPPHPYESTTSLSFTQDTLHDPYDADEYVEKQPLNAGHSFTGGFYPPL